MNLETIESGQSATPALPKLPAGASWNDDGTVLLPLFKPVRIEGSTQNGANTIDVASLVFRDLTAGDLIDSGNLAKAGSRTLFLLAASTGHVGPVGEAILRKLSGRDYVRAGKILNVFTDDGPTTGQSD